MTPNPSARTATGAVPRRRQRPATATATATASSAQLELRHSVCAITATRGALLLLPVRLFLAAGWVRSGLEKLVDAKWWTGDKILDFIAQQRTLALPPFQPVLDHIITPAAVPVAALVAFSELLIGLCIGSGRAIRRALLWGVVLNVTFVLSGRVDPSAFYLMMEAALLLAIDDGWLGPGRTAAVRASPFGVIGWLVAAAASAPFIRTLEPAHVVDDPGAILAFSSVLMALTTGLMQLNRRRGFERLRTRAGERLWAWIVCRPRDEPAGQLWRDVAVYRVSTPEFTASAPPPDRDRLPEMCAVPSSTQRRGTRLRR